MKSNLFTVVIYGICAICWTFLSVMSLMQYAGGILPFTTICYIFCAVVWSILFVRVFLKYRSEREK